MYFSTIIFFMVMVPPVVIMQGIARKRPPYKTIYVSIVVCSLATIGILAMAQSNGMALGEQLLAEATKAAEIIAGSDELAAQVGLGKLSESERVRVLVTLYGTVNSLLPCAVIIGSAIFSYLIYMYISAGFRRMGKNPPKLPAIKEFKWPPTAFLGFSIMFILSWATEFISFFDGMNILANINILFEYVMALQGLAVIFYLLSKFKVPKFLGIFVALAGIITGLGRIILFMIGIFDMFMNLRGRAKRM